MKHAALVHGQRLRIAFAIPSGIALFARIQKGVFDEVIRHGNCTIIRLPDLADPSIRWLRGWKGDGALIAVTSQREARIARKLPFPTVSLSYFTKTPDLPVVTVDNAAVGRLGAEHLLDRRFVRFGFCGTKGMAFSEDRRRGMEQVVKSAGYPLEILEIASSSVYDPGLGSLERRLDRWLKKLRPPFGILAESDFLAAAVIATCRSAGLRVPQDAAVIGVDNDSVLCDLHEPSITSISRNDHEVGRQAAKLLFHQIHGGASPGEPLFIKPDRLVQRDSTRSYSVEEPGVAKAVRYVQEHLGESFGVEALIAHCGISRRRLERSFRQELGCTPMEFIRSQRVEKAGELLNAEEGRTLTSIAQDCGFSSLLRFRLNFQQVTGLSPSEYRRSIDLNSCGEKKENNGFS